MYNIKIFIYYTVILNVVRIWSTFGYLILRSSCVVPFSRRSWLTALKIVNDDQDKFTSTTELEEAEAKKRDLKSSLKSKLKERSTLQRSADISIPTEKQCRYYRWFQTESIISVEIPMYELCRESEINLVLSESGVHISINNDPDFEPIAGAFAGKVDTTLSRYSLHSDINGNYVAMILRKIPSEGTPELWYNLLQGEVAAPTIRYRGKTQHYSWIQGPNTININFQLPVHITKSSVNIELKNNGDDNYSMSLKVDDYLPLNSFERKFRGSIKMADTFWMLDETESGDKMLNIQISKQKYLMTVLQSGGQDYLTEMIYGVNKAQK